MDTVLGIDIAKLSFEVALSRDGERLRQKGFANTKAGHRDLLRWLAAAGAGRVHACLEATGPYGFAVANALVEAGHTVSILNPAAVHAFGRSELLRSKTDKADAALIVRFCLAHRPPAWIPPAPEVKHLQALVRRATAVRDMRQEEARRLDAALDDASVRRSIRQILRHLDRELAKLRTAIREHVHATPTLREQHDLLVSIPGIGTITAATLLAEVVDMKRYASARQVAAYAGLVPQIRESGTSVRSPGHLCKMGPSRLRHALYFPALAALRVNPVVQRLRERLRERGKCPMVIVGAAMRKLLHIAYGILKSGRPFDPALAFSS
jgi:transposase